MVPPRIFVFISLFCLCCGCASIISDNDSTTYIETTPEEARCVLHGQDFKRVMTTPNSINLPSEAAPITVACSAEGYLTETKKLDTSMDGWVLGNIIFGGIIGGIVDVARGAGSKYPTMISLILQPKEFASAEKRDMWFFAREAAINLKWDAAIVKEQRKCKKKSQYAVNRCTKKVDAATSSRIDALAQLAQNRAMSVVAQPEPAVEKVEQVENEKTVDKAEKVVAEDTP